MRTGLRRRARGEANASPQSDDGFSLLELLVVLIIIPLIIGAVAAAVIAELNNVSQSDQHGAFVRLSNSHDAQITAAYLVRDVQSANSVSTKSAPVCVPSGVTGNYQVLGLEWPSPSGGTNDVSYYVEQNPLTLVRYFCSNGSFVSQSPVSSDVFSTLTAVSMAQGASCSGASSCVLNGATVEVSVTATCTDGTTTCANGGLWPVLHTSTAAGIATVQMQVLENPTTSYYYSLTGVPRLSNTTVNHPSNPANPPFIANGQLKDNQCQLLANGLIAVNDSTGTAASVGNSGAIYGTGLYTSGGTVSGPTSNYPSPYLTGPPIPSPYDQLTEPPTAPVDPGTGNPYYPTITINTPNWDPSTLPQPLSPAIYVVTAGLSVTGSKGVSGSSGVLFYVTGGSVTLGGKGNIGLSPLSPDWESPTQPLPEVVLWISRSDRGATLTLGGNGGAVTINGAIYAPTASTTINGAGTSGQIDTQAMVTGSMNCNGGGSPGNLDATVGSPLVSGTFVQPDHATISLSQSNAAEVTVTGVGHLAPTGTASVMECGPLLAPGNCTSGSTWGSSGSVTLTPNATTGTATGTSPTFVPTAPGWYCFAASYPGNVSYTSSSDTTPDGCFQVYAPPVLAITSPATGSCYAKTPVPPCLTWVDTTIGGTAVDGGAGIQKVTITIKDPHNKYWNGTAFASGATQLDATTSSAWASWTYTFPVTNFPSGDTGSYVVTATATDANGVASTTPATSTFTWNG